MADICEIEPSPCNSFNGRLNCEADQAVPERLRRFDNEPIKPGQLAYPAPAILTPTIQLPAPTPMWSLTDRQLVVILVIVIALLCTGIVVYAMRG
jgi:hypothetical protein